MSDDAVDTSDRFATLFFATMFPQTIVSFISLAPAVMAKAIAGSVGMPLEAAGYYTGLLYAAVLIGNLLSSRLISRFGPLRLSFAGVAASGAGLCLLSLGGIVPIACAAIVIGLSYGPLTPASAQVIATKAGSSSFNLIVSIRQTSVPLGGMLAGLVTPSLQLRLGRQVTCLWTGLAVIVSAALLGVGLPIVRRERISVAVARGLRIVEPLLMIVRRRRLLTLASASFVYGAVQLVLSTFLVAYLTTVVGHDLVTAGLLLGLCQLSGVGARILWGTVADRMASPRRLLMLIGFGTALACLSTTGLALVGPTALSFPVVVILGGTASGWNGVFLAEVMREVAPNEVSLATSGSLLFTYAGIVMGPAAFGALAITVGLPSAFLVAAAIVLGGALVIGAGGTRHVDPR